MHCPAKMDFFLCFSTMLCWLYSSTIFFAELIFVSLIPSLVQFMLVNVIVNGENMGMAIAVLKMATFIMDFGKKTKWMSLDAIGGQIQAAFTLAAGKKVKDMA